MAKTHDIKSRIIADEFLSDEKWFQALPADEQNDLAQRLANEVQATIEDFISTKGEFSTP